MAFEHSKPTEALSLAGERVHLEAFLDDNREQLQRLVDGLSEEEARRSLVPSLTTVLGLLKHGAHVERAWISVRLAGRSREELGLADDLDDTFRLTEQDTVASVGADFDLACSQSREAAAGIDLDQVVPSRHGPVSLRWIYLHLIEEHARHAGHGDILREQLLAAR